MTFYTLICKEAPGERAVVRWIMPKVENYQSYIALRYEPPGLDLEVIKAAYDPTTNRTIIWIDLVRGNPSDLYKVRFLLVNPEIVLAPERFAQAGKIPTDKYLKSIGIAIIPTGLVITGKDRSLIRKDFMQKHAIPSQREYVDAVKRMGEIPPAELSIPRIPSPVPIVIPPHIPEEADIPKEEKPPKEEKRKPMWWLWALLGLAGVGAIIGITEIERREK